MSDKRMIYSDTSGIENEDVNILKVLSKFGPLPEGNFEDGVLTGLPNMADRRLIERYQDNDSRYMAITGDGENWLMLKQYLDEHYGNEAQS